MVSHVSRFPSVCTYTCTCIVSELLNPGTMVTTHMHMWRGAWKQGSHTVSHFQGAQFLLIFYLKHCAGTTSLFMQWFLSPTIFYRKFTKTVDIAYLENLTPECTINFSPKKSFSSFYIHVHVHVLLSPFLRLSLLSLFPLSFLC